jgi:hypothetical protein
MREQERKECFLLIRLVASDGATGAGNCRLN